MTSINGIPGLYVQRDLSQRLAETQAVATSKEEVVPVDGKLLGNAPTFASVYFLSSFGSPTVSALSDLCRAVPGRLVISENINAHHPFWESLKSTNRGNAFMNGLQLTFLCLANDSSPTILNLRPLYRPAPSDNWTSVISLVVPLSELWSSYLNYNQSCWSHQLVIRDNFSWGMLINVIRCRKQSWLSWKRSPWAMGYTTLVQY